MTYDPQIPLASSNPKDSASPIQVNFSQFAAIFSKLVGGVYYNHMPMNDPSEGKHASVILQNQTLDPGVTEDLAVLYSKTVTQTGTPQPQLHVQIPTFLPTPDDRTIAPNEPMLLTYSSVDVAGPIFYSFLPGGYLIAFGIVTGAAITSTINMPVATTKILTVIVNPNTVEGGAGSSPVKISADIKTATQFVAYSPAAFDFTWVAIAKT